MIDIVLRTGEDRKVRQGHLWVFSNQIDHVADAPPGARPGSGRRMRVPDAPGEVAEAALAAQDARLIDSRGEPLGWGYFNPRSVIAFRLVTRRQDPPDAEWFRTRIAEADAFRRRIDPDGESYRAVYAEGDLLPGLIIDRFGDAISAQILTRGMEARRAIILEAIEKVYAPSAVVLRNDGGARTLEGLSAQVEVVKGQISGPVEINLDGLTHFIDLTGGQKTGFFLDQRENRRALRRYVGGTRVLDLFCYTGAWGLSALAGGARSVLACDASAAALEMLRRQADANGLARGVETVQGDVFAVLKSLHEKGEMFDCVVSDPPAFARTRKDTPQATLAYERLNKLALRVLAPGGILATASCSYHVSAQEFTDAVTRACRVANRAARLLEWRGQPPDHAGLLAMPEGHYLKCMFLQVL